MSTPYEQDVSSDFPFELLRADVLGNTMTYVDTQPKASSNTPTALFLHGNGSSSYLWRNIVPHLQSTMRCVAPDLIAMGNSSKPKFFKGRFTDHYTFLSSFIDQVIPDGPILLVAHDWGSALGLHWFWQESEKSGSPSNRLLGIALMEFVRAFPTWQDFGLSAELEKAFRAFRTPKIGRELVVEQNVFVKTTIEYGQLRKLDEVEIARHHQPYLEPASREVLLTWTNQVPIEQKPSDVHDIVTRYHQWLMETELPKIIFWGTPGAIITPEKAAWYGKELKNVTMVDLGQGLHYLQEDHPHEIGRQLGQWAGRLL